MTNTRRHQPTDGRPGAGKGRSTAGKRDRAAARRTAARRRRLTQIGVAIAAVGIIAAVAVFGFRGNSAGTAGSNTTTSAWNLPELNGHGRVTLAGFHGQPTVVNFFASWCEACDAELPGFHDLAQQLHGTVNFVGVDSLETGDPNYMPRRHHLPGTFAALARDVGGANNSGLHDALGGGNNMPLTAFYDSQGKLLDVERTEVPEPTLRALLHRYYGIDS